MAYRVVKKGSRYAVVAVVGDSSQTTALVDVLTGRAIHETIFGSSLHKTWLGKLESGEMTPEEITARDDSEDRDVTDDLPKSLSTMKSKLEKAQSEPKPKPKKVGLVKDHGAFRVVAEPDGTYSYRMASGEYRTGFKSSSGATLSGKRAVEGRVKSRLDEYRVDPGQDATDTLLEYYRHRVRSAYSTAADAMASKQSKMMEDHERRRAAWEAKVASGEASREDFDLWLQSRAADRKWVGDMADRLARDLTEVDRHAMDMLNECVPRSYSENFNYATYQIEHGSSISTSFTLYDESTVRRLLEQDRKLLPVVHLDDGKDFEWNRAKVTEAVTQGILQGESVPEVAKRLETVAGMDERSALRNARTALTGAQNAGRTAAFARAKAFGVQLTQEWQATYDMRTRHTHAVMDGERAEVGERFSNGLMYPGDPEGEPAEVMNCRCTLVPVTQGLDDGGAWRKDVKVGDMSYEEWKEYHRAEEERKRYSKYAGYEEGVPPLLSDFRRYSDAFLEAHMEDTGMTKGEVREFASMIQSMYDQSDVYCAVGVEALEDMVGGGHLKNVFEVFDDGRKIGDRYLEARRDIPRVMYGVDASDLPSSAFEKYGYMGSADPIKAASHGGATGIYGSVSLKLRKDRLGNRVTYTFGDSLNMIQDGREVMAGGLDDNLSVTGVDAYGMSSVYKRMGQVLRKTGGLDASDVADRCVGRNWYIETQVHGQITMDDVSEVVVETRTSLTGDGLVYSANPSEHETLKRLIDGLESSGTHVTRYANYYDYDSKKWVVRGVSVDEIV